MKRSGFKKKPTKPLKRTRLAKKGKSPTAVLKDDIQAYLRLIVTIRDGGCILRNLRHPGEGEAIVVDHKVVSDRVIQAEHLISRANAKTFADPRLVVCICRNCHGWKNYYPKQYDALVKPLISKERQILWERCEEERSRHQAHKTDLKLELLALKQEYQKLCTGIV